MTATTATTGEAFTSLYLYTHDVARQLKFSSDGELAHALHETLHYALDAQEQDWGQASAAPADDCGGGSSTAATTTMAPASKSNTLSPRLADSQPSSSAPSPPSRATTALPSVPAEVEALQLPRQVPPARDGFFPNPRWASGSHSAVNSPPSRSGTTSPRRTSPPPASSPTRHRRIPPYISYGWQARTRTLSLPHPATISNPTKLDPCSPENRSAFDVTAKIFFLDDILPPSSADEGVHARTLEDEIQSRADTLAGYIENALKRLSGSTGIITLDTLLLSFPPANFEASASSTHSSDTARQHRLQVVAELWRTLSQNPQLLSLGLSRFSLDSLQTVFHLLPGMPHPPSGPPPTTPSLSWSLVCSLSQAGQASSSYDTARWPDAYSTPREVRRPRLVTATLQSSTKSSWGTATPARSLFNGNASPFTAAAQEPAAAAMAIPSATSQRSNGTSAVNGGSQAGGLPRPGRDDEGPGDPKALLAWCEAEGIVPVADSDRQDVLPRRTLPALLKEFREALPHPIPEGHRLAPRWVMKYSVVIRDRGVLADRGYILFAEVEPEPEKN
ncbi:hypothetical protein V8E36_007322 [Tilletia maclaganii]